METGVGTTSGLIEDFAKYAHDAVEALRVQAKELEGSMTSMAKVMEESSKAFGVKFAEGTKFGNYIENNPTKTALYSFMTAVMFTHFMKARGVNISWEAPGTVEKGEAAKPKGTKAKAA